MKSSPHVLWYMWLVLFVGAVAVLVPRQRAKDSRRPGPAAARDDGPPVVGPSELDVHGLPDYLQARGLRLHVVAMYRDGQNIGDGYWLCVEPRDWKSCNLLPPLPQFRDRWVDVVLVKPRRRSMDDAGAQVEEWQECGLLARRFMIFGDPNLLKRIRNALEAKPAGNQSVQ